ncbi:hypothetical protein [Variovorax sp. YR216]|uniref:hypothetical protein n=1 Tax=Variovorax sp. YR216 TaxID=1882828 RepID=UPI0008995867|nr:hypothetical protein [Variovorax sp. YR216]SEB08305.1 hypothetical protein SAMN05444680_10765 [Variovorax sp. YR216]
MSQPSHAASGARFEVRFRSLFREGRGFAFPCDASGHVNLESLSERGRSNYLFASAMVGREFAAPSVTMALR